MKRTSSSSTATEPAMKKVQVQVEEAQARIKAAIIENDTRLDFGAAKTVVEGLVSPKTIDEFMGVYWEKQPCHVNRKQTDYYGTAFTLEALKKIVSNNTLEFSKDVDVYRYIENEKQTLSSPGKVSLPEIEKFLKEEKATVQFSNPQRYTDILWNIMEKLETFFGTHVSANVYVTPSKSQGLAPHCDESETLVLQLEGSTEWRIYEPSVVLGRDGTHDLSKDTIGNPKMTVKLMTGDLLYIPRGFVHESSNVEESSSTRIELSTYLNHTWGDFLLMATKDAIETALESKDDASFRKGLPCSVGSFLGTGKNLGKYIESKPPTAMSELESTTTPAVTLPSNEKDQRVVSFKQQIRKRLNNLVEHIDVDIAADTITSEFMAKRLPPFEYSPKSEYKAPTMQDEIIFKFKDHARVIYYAEDDEINSSQLDYNTEDEMTEDEDTEDEEMTEPEAPPKQKTKRQSISKIDESVDDEDDEDFVGTTESSYVTVIHSVHNDRKEHLTECAPIKPNMVQFPINFAGAITQLIESTDYVPVSKLTALEDDTEKLRLAVTLYDADLVEVKLRTPSRQ